jgi:hypothetical protein
MRKGWVGCRKLRLAVAAGADECGRKIGGDFAARGDGGAASALSSAGTSQIEFAAQRLAGLPDGMQVRFAGGVIARQRRAAKGSYFKHGRWKGIANAIISPPVV